MKNIGKRVFSMLFAVVLLLSMMAVVTPQAKAASDGLDLAKMQIVKPVSATAVETTAATELQTYLYKITGTKPVIKTEGQQSGNAIYVGATNYAAQNSISYPTAGDENGEAWVIKAVNGDLFLCGAPDRGPLYAVYHLLEDVLGVRWWNYWEESVPTGNAIVPADYYDSGVPAMEFRSIFTGEKGTKEYVYYVRNRMNSNMGNIPGSYGGGEVYGAPAHVHTFTLNRYFKDSELSTHPEWFSLGTNGNRNTDQLCLTNASLKTEFAARLVNNVKADPDAIYSVSPNDNTNFCQCTSCKNAVSTYGTSGYVLRFVNEMAAAVTAAGYTEATVEMLVYWAYIEAPKGGVTPAANVSIRFADNYIDLLHSLDHANNADTVKNLQAWINISHNDIYYWQYVVNYNNNGILPTMFHYGSDIVKLEAMGVNGWFAEQEQCINADFWDMKQWLIAKLMENPVSGDEYTALMDEFIYGYYGEEAGKHIRDYLYYVHGKAEATNTEQKFMDSIIGAEWLSVQDIIKGNDYFEKAVAAADGDAILLRRLRAARSGLDRVIHDNFSKWEKQAKNAGLTLPFTIREVGERIYQTMTEQIAVRGAYDPDYPKFYNSYADKYGENQAPIPSELSGVAREHLLAYTAEDFRLAAGKSYISTVDDANALTGKAFRCDTSGMSTLNSTERAVMKAVDIKAYDPNSSVNSGIRNIGSIAAKSLTRNDGYHLYSVSWTVPQMGNDSNGYIYLFEDWGLQIPSMKTDLNNLAGKTVNIFVRIKAEGNLSSSTYFKGQYYIDSILIDIAPSQPAHNYVTTPSTYGDTCRSVCSACGDVIRSEHTWNKGVVTVEPTTATEGEKLYTCTNCGATKKEVLEKVKDAIDLIPTEHLELFDYTVFPEKSSQNTSYVKDADAYNGMAVCHIENNLGVKMELSTGGTIGIISAAALNVGNGYQIHKFTYTVPSNITDGGYVFIMSSWQFQSPALYSALIPYAGKTVEIYISMKVTGPEDDNYSFYIDRIAIATSCSCDENGKCPVCGNPYSVTFKAADMELAYYNANLCDSKLADYDSQYGEAAVFSYAERLATGDQGLANEMRFAPEAEMRLHARYPSGPLNDSCVGAISGKQLQANGANGQYVIYKFSRVDLTGVDFVYMFGEALRTRFSNVQKEILSGRLVDVTLSLKVVGDVTGADSANYPSYYIDCITYTVAKLDEIDQISDEHFVSLRDYSDFAFDANEGTNYVEDAQANDGKAVCFSRADLDHLTPDEGDNRNFNDYISLHHYYNGSVDNAIGNLYKEDLKIDQGYQIYKFTYAVPNDATNDGVVYLIPNWQLNSSQLSKDLYAYAGQTVEIYLSIKVTKNTTDNLYSISVDKAALATPCQWDEGVVTTQPTVESEGVMTYTCSVCNATKTESIEKLPDITPVKAWSLTLDGSIGMNFHLNLTKEQIPGAVVSYTVGRTTKSVRAAKLPVDEKGLPVLTVDVAAAQMTEPVEITLSAGGQKLSKTYTVREYADVILNPENGYTEKVQNLVKEMLNYGAASQTYFGYNIGNLANVGITAAPATVPAEGVEVAVSGNASGVKYYGASLLHENKITVRFYFDAESTQGITFKVNGEEQTPVLKDGRFYVELSNINPQALNTDITVTVSDGTNTMTVVYAPMDYMIRMYQKGGATQALVQALYGYYQAAAAYTA